MPVENATSRRVLEAKGLIIARTRVKIVEWTVLGRAEFSKNFKETV